LVASPVVTYSFPSGPNLARVPAWFGEPGMLSTMVFGSTNVFSVVLISHDLHVFAVLVVRVGEIDKIVRPKN
jgi:hypothetical protein